MKENTFYFTHDFNAHSDQKIEAMLFDKGWEGYGLFWVLIEKLAQEPLHKLLKQYDRIAFVLHSKIETIKSIIEDYQLFSFDTDFFWSDRLNNHFEKREEKSLKAKESISKRWNKDTIVLQTNNDSNTIKESKVKESKENINKDDDLKVVAPIDKHKFKLAELLNNEYFQNKEFSELWETFSSNKKKKQTAHAKILSLDKILKVSIAEAINILKYSVEGGYPGLYMDKGTAQVMNWNKTKTQISNEELKKAVDQMAHVREVVNILDEAKVLPEPKLR